MEITKTCGELSVNVKVDSNEAKEQFIKFAEAYKEIAKGFEEASKILEEK